MLVLAAAIIALFSLAMLTIALRGRRIDDHPLCRKCGYDLTGRSAENTKCSECGRDLKRRNAIRIGHRVRHRRLAAASIILLVLSASIIGLTDYVQHHKINWMEHAPVWVLRYELNSTSTRQLDALAELTQRLKNGALTPDQIVAVSDKCLTIQADLSTPWLPVWGDFIEAAHAANAIDRTRWAKYACQAPVLAAQVRPCAVHGETIPIEPRVLSARLSQAKFCMFLTWSSETVDGKPIVCLINQSERKNVSFVVNPSPPGVFKEDALCVLGGDIENFVVPRISAEAARTLSVGEHRFAATYKILILEQDEIPSSYEHVYPRADIRALATGSYDVECKFKVLLAADMPDLTSDPLLEDQVRKSIDFEISRQQSDASGLRVLWIYRHPPVRLCFNLKVRSDGREQDVSSDSMVTPNEEGGGGQDRLSSVFAGVRKVDLIFKPNLRPARDSVDDSPTWGSEIIFKDVIIPDSQIFGHN